MLLPLSHFAVCKEEVSAACENSCKAIQLLLLYYYYSTAKTTKNSQRFTIGLDRRLSDDWRRLHHDSTTDKAKSSASGSQENTEETPGKETKKYD